MSELEAFDLECYEILNQEQPEVLLHVAELLAAGETPSEVREKVTRTISEPSEVVPLLAENAARYLRSCAMISSTSKPCIH